MPQLLLKPQPLLWTEQDLYYDHQQTPPVEDLIREQNTIHSYENGTIQFLYQLKDPYSNLWGLHHVVFVLLIIQLRVQSSVNHLWSASHFSLTLKFPRSDYQFSLMATTDFSCKLVTRTWCLIRVTTFPSLVWVFSLPFFAGKCLQMIGRSYMFITSGN